MRDRDRPGAFEARSDEIGQRRFARGCALAELFRRADCGFHRRGRVQRLHLRQPFRRYAPAQRLVDRQPRRAPLRNELRDVSVPPAACHFLVEQETLAEQRVVQLVGVLRRGPRFLAHAVDCRDVEAAQVGRSLGIEPAPRHHCLRAALLERRVVEIRVRTRGEDLEGERRGRGHLARDDGDAARLDAAQHVHEAVDVHRLVQAVVDRLPHERMVGNLAVADDVFGARDLVGEHRRHEVVGAHPLQRRGDLAAAAKRGSASEMLAIQRQRAANIGAASIACTSTSRTELECR